MSEVKTQYVKLDSEVTTVVTTKRNKSKDQQMKQGLVFKVKTGE